MTTPEDAIKTDQCKCGAKIYLVKAGLHGYKWVTNPRDKSAWHCGNDLGFPLKTHKPAERRAG